MGEKTPLPSRNASCTRLPAKQRFRMLLATKTSGYLWYLVDQFSCKLDRFASRYETFIGNEYAKEYRHMDLPKKKHVLHIGCGAYPLTGIILAQQGDAKHVIGIDNDAHSVHLAQTIIEKKHLQHRIIIKHGNGEKYPVNTFDVIIISSCSWPKIDIVDHVLSTARKNSVIILRELNHVVPPLLQCLNTHPDIVIKKHIHHSPFPFRGPFGWQSFYLLKT